MSVQTASSPSLQYEGILRQLSPNVFSSSPLTCLSIGSRHGHGGGVSALTHDVPILEALGPGSVMHVVGASPLACQNLPVTFHPDCYLARGERTPLDPLKIVNPDRLREVIATTSPNIILMLDAPEERALFEGQPLDPVKLLRTVDRPGAQLIVSADKALPVSGFWAIRTVKVFDAVRGSTGEPYTIDLYPGISDVEFLRQANVYRESDKLARLFGASGRPSQNVLPSEVALAWRELGTLGVTPSDVVIYLHAGTSTPLKEFTSTQLRRMTTDTTRSLRRAGVDLSSLAFVVSPEPVARPEVSKALCDVLTALGTRAVVAPKGSFGLFRGLIGVAGAVICADTAAGHIANALGTPCYALYGNPDPAVPVSLWGPVAAMSPNSVATLLPSETPLAREMFPRLAQASRAHYSDAEFFAGVVIAAAVEGWGSRFRSVPRQVAS